MTTRAEIEILVIEDDPTTAFVYRDVFARLSTPTRVPFCPTALPQWPTCGGKGITPSTVVRT